jgi:hypothetical protein
VAGSRVCVVAGVVSHPPIRRLPRWAGAMTVPSGTGLLSQISERGLAGSWMITSSLGVWRPLPGSVAPVGGAGAVAA